MTDRADAPWPGSKANALLTLTETGMLLYWLLAALMATGLLSLPPQWMYYMFQYRSQPRQNHPGRYCGGRRCCHNRLRFRQMCFANRWYWYDLRLTL